MDINDLLARKKQNPNSFCLYIADTQFLLGKINLPQDFNYLKKMLVN